jgi:hypothetical protein
MTLKEIDLVDEGLRRNVLGTIFEDEKAARQGCEKISQDESAELAPGSFQPSFGGPHAGTLKWPWCLAAPRPGPSANDAALAFQNCEPIDSAILYLDQDYKRMQFVSTCDLAFCDAGLG